MRLNAKFIYNSTQLHLITRYSCFLINFPHPSSHAIRINILIVKRAGTLKSKASQVEADLFETLKNFCICRWKWIADSGSDWSANIVRDRCSVNVVILRLYEIIVLGRCTLESIEEIRERWLEWRDPKYSALELPGA